MNRASPELEARMIAVFRKIGDGSAVSATYEEARAIAAELPAPVDPDLQTAKELAQEHGLIIANDSYHYNQVITAMLAAVRHGRALARQESPQ